MNLGFNEIAGWLVLAVDADAVCMARRDRPGTGIHNETDDASCSCDTDSLQLGHT